MTRAWSSWWLAAAIAVTGVSSPVFAASGCDSIASIPITWNINYENDIQAIFNNRCSGCHVKNSPPAAGLDLNPGASWDSLVNAPSQEQLGRLLVVPAQPLASVMFEKINCAAPNVGLRMPRVPRIPLPLNEQALIYDWIMLGAPLLQTDFIFVGGFEQRP